MQKKGSANVIVCYWKLYEFYSGLMLCRKLAGRTLFITGASRGIGKAIALKAARDGANVVIAAKTAEPHPKLPGTIYTAAKESMYCTVAWSWCVSVKMDIQVL